MIHEIYTHPWKFATKPFRIAGNLYYVGNADVSAYLLDTGEGLILIDTAFPQTVYLVLESIRMLGFDPHDITHILHSHGHYDHFGGTKAISALIGAKTYLGAEDIFILKDRQELSWAPEYGIEFYEAFDVDFPVSDGSEVALGRTTIECVGTPGHTPGALSFFFEVQDNGKPYRVGMHGGPGLNTLSDAYLAKYNLPRDNRTRYMQSLVKLREQHVDIFVGIHPNQSDVIGKSKRAKDGAPNPFIDPRCWTQFLDGLETNARTTFGERP